MLDLTRLDDQIWVLWGMASGDAVCLRARMVSAHGAHDRGESHVATQKYARAYLAYSYADRVQGLLEKAMGA